MTVNLGQTTHSLNWKKHSDKNSLIIFHNIMEGITKVEFSGKKIQTVANLASEITPFEGGKVWDIKLRNDILWSDGKKLNASDFIFSWKKSLENKSTYIGLDYLKYIKNGESFSRGEVSFEKVGIKKTGELTLRVILEHPVSLFPMFLSHPSTFPVRKTHISSDFRPSRLPILGQFKPASWNEGKLTLIKNNLFFGKNGEIETVEVLNIDDSYTASSLVKQGALDVNISIPENFNPSDQSKLLTENALRTIYLGFNTTSKLISPTFRNYFSSLIERGQLVDILKNRVSELNQWAPKTLYSQKNKSLNSLPAKISKKQEAIKLRFLLPSNERAKLIAQNIKYQVEKKSNSLEIELIQRPWKYYLQELKMGSFDIYFAAWTADIPHIFDFYQILHSTSKNNHTRWKNTRYDELLDNMLRGNSLKQIPEELERIISIEKPVIPLLQNRVSIELNHHILIKPNPLKIYRFGEATIID